MHVGDSVTVTADGLMGLAKVWLLPLMLQVCTITVVGSIIVVTMTFSVCSGCGSVALAQ